jgi:hypothetical protein
VGEKTVAGMAIKRDQHVWAAVLYRAGVADMFGAVRVSPRLHWTEGAARKEAQGWIEEMQIGPIIWEWLDDQMVIGDQIVIGRNGIYLIIIYGMLLPTGPRHT